MNPEQEYRVPAAGEWRADLAIMASEMERLHSNLFHTVSRRRFLGAVKRLQARVPALDRHRIIVEIARIVALVGDAHTTVYLRHYDPAVEFHFYPLRLWLAGDELFVRATDVAHEQLLGARISRIGTRSVREAIKKVEPVISAENYMRVRAWAPALLVVPEVLHALGISTALTGVPFRLEQDGTRSTVYFEPVPPGTEVPWIDAAGLAGGPTPLWLKDPTNAFWFEYLADSRTLYLQYNAVADKPDETLEQFFKRVFSFVDANDVERFVIDLRSNGGGDNRLNWPLIYGLIRSDKVNEKGRLFTIIGRETFSAAMNCANALEKHTNTLFVGEPTGTSPNHYGDAERIVLPHSGLSVFASTLYWQDSLPYDDRRWIEPQIPAMLTREDYLANRDPAMEAILRYKPGA
ncbi:MAG: hypothetical protein ACJ78Q_18900 [Chloroflexia bacterium]